MFLGQVLPLIQSWGNRAVVSDEAAELILFSIWLPAAPLWTWPADCRGRNLTIWHRLLITVSCTPPRVTGKKKSIWREYIHQTLLHCLVLTCLALHWSTPNQNKPTLAKLNQDRVILQFGTDLFHTAAPVTGNNNAMNNPELHGSACVFHLPLIPNNQL